MKFIIILLTTTFASLAYPQSNDFIIDIPTNFIISSYMATNGIISTSNINNDFNYTYKAKVVKVVDGDTVDLLVDVGFDIFVERRFRLFGINAPEMKNDDNNSGHVAKKLLIKLIDNKEVIIKTEKDKIDKYGRYLVTIFLDGVNINSKMVEDGRAIYKNY